MSSFQASKNVIRGMSATELIPVFEPAREQAPILDGLFHQWVLKNGVVGAEFYHVAEGYLLRFPELADFCVSKNGLEVRVIPVKNVSEHSISHLFLNQVLPLALSRQFRMVLHASAVQFEEGAIAFVGPSGLGKSTLAASFSSNGCGFLTDDGLEIEAGKQGFVVNPSHPSIRLWEDSRTALFPNSNPREPAADNAPKYRLLAGEEVLHCNEPCPLRLVYFLTHEAVKTVEINPVKGREAMLSLVRNCFLLDIEEREMLTRQFGKLSVLARAPIFFQLNYPRSYEALPTVRDAILSHAGSLGNQVSAAKFT